MVDSKLNPSLFDKLTINDRITSIVDDGQAETLDPGVTQLRFKSATQIDRFNETAMRASVRRELNWLLNTVRLESVQDLSHYPQVRTSVLNYGLPDLTGRVSTAAAVRQRSSDIRQAVITFEPRFNPDRLRVDAEPSVGLDNSIRFTIRGDITSAVKAMPTLFYASVEVETGEAIVRE